MRVALVSFTKTGAHMCRRIEIGLAAGKHLCMAYGMETYAEEAGILPLKGSLALWTKDAFATSEALVFVGACGIAVRTIAPYIKDKTVDPAVVVVDEIGKYAISLLSGHIGGANDLALEIAWIIGAMPVITTATDLNKKFAVDDWAQRNNLWLGEMQTAKEISVGVLNGQVIGFSSDYPIEGRLPEQLRYETNGRDLTIGFMLSIYENKKPFKRTLHLVPKTVTIGMGCKKGISLDAAEALLHKVLKEQGISIHAIEKLCSIDIKKEEEALNQLAQKLRVPFEVFPAQELAQVEGEFTTSDFVHSVTGVNNVSERAAILGSNGRLIIRKQILNGVTLALAIRDENYQWNIKTDYED